MSSYDVQGAANPSSCTQFDLVMAIQCVKTPRLTWIHQHVKGHQDDHPDRVLTALELINVEMDTKAKSHWAATHEMLDDDRLHSVNGQPWMVSLGDTRWSPTYWIHCKDWCQRPRIHKYWIEKGRFEANELNNVNYKQQELH
jgi:hypothetical protein